MRKEEILEILTDWNFWAKEVDVGVKRESYVRELLNLITKTSQIVCVSGVRRAGKSTLIKQVVKQKGRKLG